MRLPAPYLVKTMMCTGCALVHEKELEMGKEAHGIYIRLEANPEFEDA